MRRCSCACLLASALVSAACAANAPARLGQLPDVRHLVLVTIDTLRADNTSAYGYPLDTTPWLADLASKGVVFGRAYAQSATTKPSHASLFTGLYPVQHGVQNNTQVLDEEFQTLAEWLRDQGYRTAAFVSADAPLGGNIGQGFDEWDQPQPGDRQGPAGKLYRPAGDTIDHAISWLREAVTSDDKLFLWVHLYDPHKPMNPPAEHRSAIASQIEEIGRQQHVELLSRRDIPADDPEVFEAVLQYDSEIRYADAELARLYRAMDGFGLNQQGLWLVASDHGQGLGAHDWFGHSVQIYNAQLHVPLVFWFTGGQVPARRIDDRVVELVDVLPTVVELVGGASFDQIMPLRGESLVPSLRGVRPQHPKRFAYSERSRYVDPNPNRLTKGNYEPGSRYAYQDLEYKYLLFTEGPDELYYLPADPYELDDLIGDPAHAEDAEQMRQLLTAMLGEATSNRPVQSVSEDEIARLRALGYIQ